MPRIPFIVPACLCFLVLALGGCKSAEKSFERASELEAEGRYTEAARFYIEALERDSDLDAARTRLGVVGPRAVQLHADAIASDESAGAFERALDELDRLESLLNDAYDVGVPLDPPADLAAYRPRLTQGAIREVLVHAELAEARGDWEEALEAYTRVRERYATKEGLLRDMALAQGRVLLRWAEADLDRDAPKSAFERAQAALDLLREEGADLGPALNIQQIALDRGTRRVAILPLWRLDAWQRAAPATVLTDLNDILAYDYWTNPPPFIAVADPVAVRRTLRRLRYHNTGLTRNQIAEVGRDFDADYAVFAEAVKYTVTDKVIDEELREARTRGRNALDTTYTYQRIERTITAEIEYRLVDTAMRLAISERSVDVEVEERFERAEYAGAYTDLDLSASQRDLFNPAQEADVQRVLNDLLVDALADELATEVFDDILRRIR